MRLRDYVQKAYIFTQMKPRDKSALFEALARRMARFFPKIDAKDLQASLEEREAQTTTGVGHGVAIPHARVAGLNHTVCALAQIPQGLEFNAVDKEKVYCVFLLISPVNAMGRHIKVLARLARLVKREAFIDQIIRADSADEIYQLLSEEDAQHVD